MSQDPAYDRFLKRCETLTNKRVKLTEDQETEVSRAVVGCWIPRNEKVSVYKDAEVLIVRSLDSHAMVIEKRVNHNPVIGRDAKGEVFRYHDEWRDIEAHVMGLTP